MLSCTGRRSQHVHSSEPPRNQGQQRRRPWKTGELRTARRRENRAGREAVLSGATNLALALGGARPFAGKRGYLGLAVPAVDL